MIWLDSYAVWQNTNLIILWKKKNEILTVKDLHLREFLKFMVLILRIDSRVEEIFSVITCVDFEELSKLV